MRVDSTSRTGLVWVSSGTPALISVDKDGYFTGTLKKHAVKAHRVVYALTTGLLPPAVDHIDGDIRNNAPNNLREASLSENQHNRVGRGYYWNAQRGKWQAQIAAYGRSQYLGRFNTEAEARTAYLEAKRKLHPTAPERCFNADA